MMRRLTTGFAIGIAVMLAGVFVALKAEDLATQWQMIGPNAWGGTMDPSTRNLYEAFGIIAACFGLFLTGATFLRWLSLPGIGRTSHEQNERMPYTG